MQSFDQLVDSGALYAITVTEENWSIIREHVSLSKRELYDLPISAIQWLYQNDLLKYEYRSVIDISVSGPLSKEQTALVYSLDILELYLRPNVGIWPLDKDDRDRYSLLPMIRGKILSHIATKSQRHGYPTLNDVICASYHTESTHSHRSISSILDLSISEDQRRLALGVAVFRGYKDILLKHLRKSNCIAAICSAPSVHPNLYEALKELNIDPSWFRCYLENTEIPQNISGDLWRRIAAGIIVYSPPTDAWMQRLRSILERYRNSVSPETKANIIDMTKKCDISKLHSVECMLSQLKI